MKITIETIPHEKQRYPTVGDWQTDSDGNIVIKVSELWDFRMNALVAIHELIEAVLCKDFGISQAEVDQFDIEFEKKRKPHDQSEAGDSVAAPYAAEHCIATGIERILAAQMGVAWEHYEAALNKLG